MGHCLSPDEPVRKLLLIALALPWLAASVVVAAPPDRAHADEYVSQLLDEADPQHYLAASRLAAVGQRDGLPAEVERRLVAYLSLPPSPTPAAARLIDEVTAVLATTRPHSPVIGAIIDALALTLHQQPLPDARRGAADALFMIARHTTLPGSAVSVLVECAFADPDRKVRISAMRALIQAGPDQDLKRRLHERLMAQAAMSDAQFAAPEAWDYDVRNDHNAVLALLWNLHAPDAPQSVMALWIDKLTDRNLQDTARRMLENVVQQGPLPAPIYAQLLAVAESGSPMIDPGFREQLYRLLLRSPAQDDGAVPARVDDLALARTFAFDPETGKRRTAGYRLREIANRNVLTHESLELLATVAEQEPDRELRELALRTLGYAAPKEYVDVLHHYFDSGRYDQLILRIFLASYGRDAWVRAYAGDAGVLPKVRAAAIYDYARSGFAVPDDMLGLLQAVARDDPEYEVRQAAGQALRYLDAWVPLQTRLERQENQQQALYLVWLAAVAIYPLSGVLGIFVLLVRWSRVRQRFSALGICAWVIVAVALVPAIGIGALSMLRHNGPVPSSREMLFTFLPTYLLVAYFAYSAVQMARVGLQRSAAPAGAR